MCGKLGGRAKRLELVALRIERRELQRPPGRFHSRIALACESIHRSAVEPTQGVAGVRIHRLVAPLASSIQVLQQVAVDKAPGRKRESVQWIAVERGPRGSQGFRSLALAVLRPASGHPEDV